MTWSVNLDLWVELAKMIPFRLK